MVSATCGGCGAELKVPETLVPPSGKIMKCNSCGKPVTVMPPGARAMGFPAAPPVKATAAGLGDAKKPGLAGGPSLAAFDDAAGGLADELELDDSFLGGGSLGDVAPPPKQSPLAGAEPSAARPEAPSPLAGAGDFFDDLPAPVGPAGRGITDLPAPVGPGGRGITDLPAPVGPAGRGITDLPAPVGPSPGITDLPAPVGAPGDVIDLSDDDLLAPVGPGGRGITDLPAPVGPGGRGITDLPAPVGPGARTPDLPAPVGPTPSGNLPRPVGANATYNLVTPVGPTSTRDQVAPVGATPSGNLPAPKGFFDDVQAPSPKRPSSTSAPDLPAPKGFFDDAGPGDAMAPKGFFDDVPAPKTTAAGVGAGRAPASPADDARGFFDDVAPAPGVGNQSGALDLDDLDLAPPAASASAPPLDLGAPSPNAAPPLDLGSASQSLDLGGGEASFGNIELPSVGGGGGGGDMDLGLDAPSSAPMPSFSPDAIRADEGLLDLDDEARDTGLPKKKATVAAKARTAEPEAAASGPKKRTVIIAAAVLLVAGLGAGGYWYWTQRQAAEKVAGQVDALLTNARAFLSSDKPGHWDKARAEAQKALAIDDDSHAALGIAAQAVYGGYLDEGTKLEERRTAGRTLVARINDVNASGPEATKAEALRSIFDGEPKLAIAELGKVLRDNPGDTDAPLYLGWAHAAARDWKNAVAAFKRALVRSPRRIPALYGLARAELALGNTDAARTAFADLRKRDQDYKELPDHIDHLGALVGSYQLAEVKRFADRENLFLEITNHSQKDLADPRAVSLAWSLAGDQALIAGRVDEARRRYETAAQLDAENPGATVGAARADLAQNHLEQARTKLEAVRAVDPDNLDATLALAEVAVAQERYEEASELVTPILERDPPLDNKYELARAHLVKGDIVGAATEDGRDLAIAEYRKAVTLVPPDDDIRPTVALAKALAAHPERDKAAEAKDILEPITERAKDDPALAVTLGLAYRSAGENATAEAWFRTALERRPNDTEALFQLGKALYERGQAAEAIEHLVRAFAEGNREDVGRQLAEYYEKQNQDDAAGQIYAVLLNVKNPSIDVRARAGRFFARTGDTKNAREQGELILAEKPRHPAGLFLRAESLLAEGKASDATRLFREATVASGEAQFHDGLGRALLMLDPPAMDEAIKAFKDASAQKGAESYLSPRLGVVCARMMRRDFRADRGKVLDAIDDAARLDSKNAFLAYSTGEVYHATGDLKKAVRAYQQSLKLGVPWPGVRAFVNFRLGLAAKDIDDRGTASRALENATNTYESLARSGEPWGDWLGCPLRLMNRDAAPRRANDDPPWVTEAYRSLGYVEYARSNKGGARRAWETYLGRDPADRDEAADVRRLLMYIKGH